jgi:putative ABC transport system permease protein
MSRRRDRARRRDRVKRCDIAREAITGLRQRWMRAALCALGIGLGVAAVVVVLAIPASTQRALLDQLGRDGNLLTVASGNTIDNRPVPLPASAPGMVRRIDGVQRVSPVSYLTGRIVRRTTVVPVADTSGISVLSADPSLPSTLDLTLSSGRFLDAATARYPGVVLGSGAAAALGSEVGAHVYLSDSDGTGGQYLTVLGVLAPVPLAAELDTSALVGTAFASAHLDVDGKPTRIYLRADPDRVSAVRGVLAPTASPSDPGSVSVGRPSDLLVARAAARTSLRALALGLGAVALLVGGVGVANVMVVSVLERRGEIGLRRALGATRAVVGLLFLAESTLLCLLGAVLGALLGVAVSVGYAALRRIEPLLPGVPIALGLAGSLLVGLVAGLYPALRAARLTPTSALRGE